MARSHANASPNTSSRESGIPPPPVAELFHVSKVFRSEGERVERILMDVSLAVWEGEFLALLGQSGSGKSTVLRCLTGLLAPSGGRVRCHGKPLRGIHPELAVVFQTFALYPWLTVEQNIAVGLLSKPWSAVEKKKAIERATEMIGLSHYHAAYPREISGGMRQRVGIARALVSDPSVLCLDEAFSSLDVLTAENLRQEILALWQRKESRLRSVFMVTHNIEEAVEMATRVCVLFPNPGRVGLEIRNPLPYPRDPRSAEFQRIVATIHDAITTCTLPDEPVRGGVVPVGEGAVAGALSGVAAGAPVGGGAALDRAVLGYGYTESLPNVPVGQMLGLLSILRDEPALSNVYQIADEVGREFGETLALVKAAEILELVDTPKHEVLLTHLGKSFLEADREKRQAIFRKQIGKLRLFAFLERLLRERGRVEAAEMLREIADSLPHENTERVFQTVIAWGRYAGLLEYNADAREISLGRGSGGKRESPEEGL
jgi:NitT/TauT family transport system ATP-binding protein